MVEQKLVKENLLVDTTPKEGKYVRMLDLDTLKSDIHHASLQARNRFEAPLWGLVSLAIGLFGISVSLDGDAQPALQGATIGCAAATTFGAAICGYMAYREREKIKSQSNWLAGKIDLLKGISPKED